MTDLTLACAELSVKAGAKFVDLSSARIYDGEKKISDESAKCKPWTEIARSKLLAEEGMAKVGPSICWSLSVLVYCWVGPYV